MEEYLRQTTDQLTPVAFSNEKDREIPAEWSIVENKLRSDCSGQLNGFIVARLPELNDSTASVEYVKSEQNIQTGYKRKIAVILLAPWCYSFRMMKGTAASAAYCFRRKKIENRVESSTADTFSEAEKSKKRFYTVLINSGIILLICGGFLFLSGKRGEKTDVKTAEKPAAVIEKKAENKEYDIKTKAAAELAAKQKAEEEAKKKAEDAVKAKAAAELAAKQKAEEEAKKKAEDAVKAKAAAELAAKQKAEEEAKKKLAENSPWERPATDYYSPWTMNAPDNSDAVSAADTPTPSPAEYTVPQTVPAATPQVAASGYANSAKYTPYTMQRSPQYHPQAAEQYPTVQVPASYPSQYIQGTGQYGQPYGQQYNQQYAQIGWSAHQQLSGNGAVSGAIPMQESPASYQTQYNQYSQYAAANPNPVYVASRPQVIPQQASPQIPQGQPVIVPQYGIQQPVQGNVPAGTAPVMPIPQPSVSYPVPYSGQPYYSPAPIR